MIGICNSSRVLRVSNAICKETTMDTVSPETRSRIMSNVGHKNTGPERLLRSALHRSGLRYRLHVRELPGTPDLVFPRFGAVAFVHGCYWHSHGCYKSTMPKSNRSYWRAKFRANKLRDERNRSELQESGWRVLVVWECSLHRKHALSLDDIVATIVSWLEGTDKYLEISGRTRK